MASGDRIKISGGIDWDSYSHLSIEKEFDDIRELTEVFRAEGSGFLGYLQVWVNSLGSSSLISKIEVILDNEKIIELSYDYSGSSYRRTMKFEYAPFDNEKYFNYESLPLIKHKSGSKDPGYAIPYINTPLFFNESLSVNVVTGRSVGTDNKADIAIVGGVRK